MNWKTKIENEKVIEVGDIISYNSEYTNIVYGRVTAINGNKASCKWGYNLEDVKNGKFLNETNKYLYNIKLIKLIQKGLK